MSTSRKSFLYLVAMAGIATLVYFIKPSDDEIDQINALQETNQNVINLDTDSLSDSNKTSQDKKTQDEKSSPKIPNDTEMDFEELAPQTQQSTNLAMMNDLSTLSPPDVEAIKKDLEKESHATPPSLMGFARNMVPHVQRALTVESYSESVFSYLVDCALDNAGASLSESARASCYMNAYKIAQKYPDKYKTKFENLKGHLPERIKDIVSDFVSDS